MCIERALTRITLFVASKGPFYSSMNIADILVRTPPSSYSLINSVPWLVKKITTVTPNMLYMSRHHCLISSVIAYFVAIYKT